MKDGMNSASRYYLNQFRDAYRQATIDILTGQIVSESLMSGQLESDDVDCSFYEVEKDDEATAEHVKSIILDCQKLLIPDLNKVVGSWGLIGKFHIMYLDIDDLYYETRNLKMYRLTLAWKLWEEMWV